MKHKLIILTGPTAVGKSELAVKFAKRINAEIISADSMQVYRKMDIGTAKLAREEMGGINHYLIDELDPDEEFNVAIFQKLAKKYIETIYQKQKIPMIVGGTGFYIQSVLYDINFEETEQNKEYRKELEDLASEKGVAFLHNRLREIDSCAAEQIHENNVKRVIRALEYYYLTNNKISEHNITEHAKESPYDFCYFVLNDNRDLLYDRIDRRVDKMIDTGLIDEVSKLMEAGYTKDMISMQGLGYKEIITYLSGECTFEEAICILKRDTRHFAKRQLTWFRRERDVIWIDKGEAGYDDDVIINIMLEQARERGLI